MTVPSLTLTHLAGQPGLPSLLVGPSLGTTAAALWGEVAALLGDRLHVLGWDLPGHGRSTPAEEPFTIEELARAVLDGVDAVRGAEEAFLHAGDSIGGAVALTLGLLAPERVRGLAAVCTGAVIGRPQTWADRIAAVRTGGTASLVDATKQRWFAPGFAQRRPDVVAALLSALVEADDGGYVRCCEALASYDIRTRLGEIEVPVVVVAGSLDRGAPADLGREIASGVPGARYVELDGVGHQAPVEAPVAVAHAIASLAETA